jgi:hypothetical protein
MSVDKNTYFAYRSFWPEIETMKKFRECGIDTFTFMVSNTVNSLGTPYTKYPPVWKWNNIYDLSAFDRQIGDILEAVPDAKLICMIDLNTPHWWTRYLGAFGVKYDSFYELGKISASKTWRQDTVDYMQTLLRHAEEKYSENIVAYILGGGGATEWHDRSRGEESIYRTVAYRKWQEEHGKNPTDIPPRIMRDAGSYDFDTNYVDICSYYNGIDPTGCFRKLFPDGAGLFRTPERNGEAIGYWRFCNEFNADTVRFFLSKAREVINNKTELGVFFGYCVGHWTMVSSGHLAYERLLEAEELDFIMAPIDYMGRGMGKGSTSMTVRESIRTRGKRMLQEMDQRTWTSNRKLADFIELADPLENDAKEVEWRDETDSKELSKKFSLASDGVWKNDDEITAGMKRDAAFCLINKDSLWWFDMWGGFYKGDKVFKTLKKLKSIWDSLANIPSREVSEILMVQDPDNMYLLNDMDARCGTFHNKTKDALSTIGMPYTSCSFADFEQLDMERFKVVVMCHPFELTEKHNDILKRLVLNNGRSVVWLYGPGIINNGRWDAGNVKKVCGSKFMSENINAVNMKGWTSIYINDPRRLTPEILRKISLDAGCHSYCKKLRPVCANNKLISIHSAEKEELEVRFPEKNSKITELFSGQEFHNTQFVKLSSDGPETYLFLCE